MSDPIPPQDSFPEADPHHSDTPADSGPIDIHELLESTRKLFLTDDLPPEDLVNGNEARATTDAPAADAGESPASAVTGEVDEPPASPNPTSEEEGVGDVEADVEAEAEDVVLERRGFTVLAAVSLVLALLASPVAVIFGYIALGQARRANQRGETLALWGIGLGWVVLAAWVVGLGSLWWIAAQEGVTLDSLSELIEFLSIP